MSTKTKIILLSVILSIFVVAIIVIAVIKTKPAVDEPQDTEHNYAVNEVKDREDETEPEETQVEEKNLTIGNIELTHVERLTPEQSADKSSMLSKLHNRASYDEETHGKIVSEEIMSNSLEYRVYIQTTFEDGSTQIYVCNYDPTNLHSFLRCVSLEEWEYYESGENAG